MKVNHSQENKHWILSDNESKTSTVCQHNLGNALICVSKSSWAVREKITTGRKDELQFAASVDKMYDIISSESEASSVCVTNGGHIIDMPVFAKGSLKKSNSTSSLYGVAVKTTIPPPEMKAEFAVPVSLHETESKPNKLGSKLATIGIAKAAVHNSNLVPVIGDMVRLKTGASSAKGPTGTVVEISGKGKCVVALLGADHGKRVDLPRHDLEVFDAAGDLIPDEFCCPVSFEFLREPAIAKDQDRAHRVELALLQDWVSVHGTNPLTMLPMRTQDILVDNLLKEQISLWLARHPKHQATAQQEAADAKALAARRRWRDPIDSLLAAGHTTQAFHLSRRGEVMAASSDDFGVYTYSRSVWGEDGLSQHVVEVNEAADFAKMSNGHIPRTVSFNKVKCIVLRSERIHTNAVFVVAREPKALLAVISTAKGTLIGRCEARAAANMCIDVKRIGIETLCD